MRMAYAVTNYELLREDKTTRAGILEEAKITQGWLLVRTMSRDERCFFFLATSEFAGPCPSLQYTVLLRPTPSPNPACPAREAGGPWTASQRFKGLQRAVVLMAWQNPTQQCNKSRSDRLLLDEIVDQVCH